MTQQSYALWRGSTRTMTEQLAYSVLKESNACSDTDILSVTGGVLRVRRSVTRALPRHMCATYALYGIRCQSTAHTPHNPRRARHDVNITICFRTALCIPGAGFRTDFVPAEVPAVASRVQAIMVPAAISIDPRSS